MKISTRFSEGDTVYYLINGKIESFIVQSINVRITNYYDRNQHKQKESYSSDIYGKNDFINSVDLFKSVKDLLNSLNKTFNEK